MTLPAFKSQIYVASALTLDWVDDAGQRTADLDAGTYDSIHTLMANLTANMTTASVGNGNDTITYSISSVGKVTFISDGSTFELLWQTNTNGESDDIALIVGFDSDDDDTGSTSYEGDYQHKYGWYPTHVPARDPRKRREYVGGESRTTLSGSNTKRLYIATRQLHRWRFELVEKQYTFAEFATSTNTNKDFETQIWIPAVQGYEIRYYADASSSTVTETLYIKDNDFDSLEDIARPHDDYEAYDFDIPFRVKTT